MTDQGEREVAQGLDAAGSAVDRRLRIGVGLTTVGVVMLVIGTGLGFWASLGIGLFFLLLPSLSLAQLPLLRAYEVHRIPVYLGSGATILVIGVVALLLGLPSGGVTDLRLTWIPLAQTLGWVVGATAAGLGVIAIFAPLERGLSGGSSRLTLDLIPRTADEKRVFAGLSLAAGLGEETAYRGYALSVIQLLGPGPWLAAVVSSLAFGVLHAYQGSLGIVRTGMIGFILAVPTLLTGSLVPAMIAHTLIDLVAGFVIGPRMLARSEGCRNLSFDQ
jgi:membrane protease YdiL (CAAX protease family)